MLERVVENYLVKRVAENGGEAVKFEARPSDPDRLLLGRDGRVAFVEVKRPGGKPRPGQVRRLAALRARGYLVRVIDSKDAVDALVEYLVVDDFFSEHGRNEQAD